MKETQEGRLSTSEARARSHPRWGARAARWISFQNHSLEALINSAGRGEYLSHRSATQTPLDRPGISRKTNRCRYVNLSVSKRTEPKNSLIWKFSDLMIAVDRDRWRLRLLSLSLKGNTWIQLICLFVIKICSFWCNYFVLKLDSQNL